MKKNILILSIFLLLLVMLSGCSNSEKANLGGMVNSDVAETRENEVSPLLLEGDGYPYVLTDYLNHQFVLEEMPGNWAVLSGTYLNMWYYLGGESVCATNLNTAPVDEEYFDQIVALPNVGAVYNPNLELIMEIDPEFTIAQIGIHNSVAAAMNEMGKPAAVFKMKSYMDVLGHLRAFGKLLENEGKAEQTIAQMEADKEAITALLPEESKSVVIMYVTASTLSVKLDHSIAGDVANILGLDNIASGLPPDTLGSETTPLDVEYIAEMSPDVILMTSMIGSNEDAMNIMNKEFEENPVWQTVEAVTNKSIVYLPQEYFLFNAGHRYVEAIEYMAKGVYPEIYGELDE